MRNRYLLVMRGIGSDRNELMRGGVTFVFLRGFAFMSSNGHVESAVLQAAAARHGVVRGAARHVGGADVRR